MYRGRLPPIAEPPNKKFANRYALAHSFVARPFGDSNFSVPRARIGEAFSDPLHDLHSRSWPISYPILWHQRMNETVLTGNNGRRKTPF